MKRKNYLFVLLCIVFLLGCTADYDENGSEEVNYLDVKSQILQLAEDYGLKVKLDDSNLKEASKKGVDMGAIEKEFQQLSKLKGSYRICTEKSGTRENVKKLERITPRRSMLGNGDVSTEYYGTITSNASDTLSYTCAFFASWEYDAETEVIDRNTIYAHGVISCTGPYPITEQSSRKEIYYKEKTFVVVGTTTFSKSVGETYIEFSESYIATCGRTSILKWG